MQEIFALAGYLNHPSKSIYGDSKTLTFLVGCGTRNYVACIQIKNKHPSVKGKLRCENFEQKNPSSLEPEIGKGLFVVFVCLFVCFSICFEWTCQDF